MHKAAVQDLRNTISSVKSLLIDQQLIDAEKLIDSVENAGTTENYIFCMLAAKVKRKLSDDKSAKVYYQQACVLEPQKAAAYIELASICLHQADCEAAARYIDIAESLEPEHSKLLQLRYKLAEIVNDKQAKITLLSQLIDSEAKLNPIRVRKLLQMYLQEKHFDGAQALLDKYKQTLPGDETLLQQAEIAIHLGDAVRAAELLQAAIASNGKNTAALALLIKLYTDIGEKEQAENLLHQIIDSGFADVNIYHLVSSMVLPKLILTKALKWATTLPLEASAKERRVANSIKSLSQHVDDSLTTEGNAEHLSAAPLLRPIVEDDLSEFIMAQLAGADTVLLVFTGLANKTGMPLRTLDHYLASFNTSVIYLRDSSRLLFNNGVASLAGSFDLTVNFLQKTIGQLDAKRLIILGVSAGGFAAVRYGMYLEADKIVCCGAPTNLNADFLVNDGRARIICNRLQILTPEVRDLKPIISQSEKKPPIKLYYGANMPQDKLHAAHLADLTNLSIYEIADTERHDLLKKFEEDGSLRTFLQQLLE